jgi:methyltransferase (TIGR00027 family)
MDQSASKTAALVAAYRGRASARSDRICDDPWAAELAGEDGRDFARRLDEGFPHGELWLAVRTAFIDAAIRRLTREDPSGTADPPPARQVVILGAGLDTRAARLSRAGIRYFEVDRSESQDDKLRKLADIEGYPKDAATYVPCNFEHQDFLDRLIVAGFVPDEPSVIVWEGVTYYLGEDTVRSTMRRIAEGCHPRTVVIFDYVQKKLISADLKDEKDLATRDVVNDFGEPLRWGIDDVLPLLYAEGFRHVRVTSFDEACLSLTGTYERERKFRFQHLCMASRTVADW